MPQASKRHKRYLRSTSHSTQKARTNSNKLRHEKRRKLRSATAPASRAAHREATPKYSVLRTAAVRVVDVTRGGKKVGSQRFSGKYMAQDVNGAPMEITGKTVYEVYKQLRKHGIAAWRIDRTGAYAANQHARYLNASKAGA
jgi:hypothetical protein